jgi:hypothetical protein
MDLAVARAPHAPLGAPLYESHYVTATAPGGRRALWLRYTAHKERGEPARGSLWCTWFDAGSAPVARRTTSPTALAAPPPATWALIDGAEIAPGRAHGALADCTWTLEWQAQAPPLPYLPSARLYDRRFPRSNGIALAPSATLSGQATIAGERIDLDGWRGMVGHNWGADHAERWIWLHATGFGDRDPGGWLDVVLARVRIGPVLSPWLPAGALALDGGLRTLRLGAAVRGLRVEVEGESLVVATRQLEIRATSPAPHTVTWDYASPGGGGREVRNCSIASATVRAGDGAAFELRERVAVELGGLSS